MPFFHSRSSFKKCQREWAIFGIMANHLRLEQPFYIANNGIVVEMVAARVQTMQKCDEYGLKW
jgi:hypothetical protein